MTRTEDIRHDNGVKVLLVGNYSSDAQESMRRFADLLALQLPDRGILTEQMCPSPVFGGYGRSTTGVGKWLGYIDKLLLFPGKLRRRLRRTDSVNLVHICDHSNAVYTRVLRNFPHLVTCHDLLAVRSARGEFSQNRTRKTGRLYQQQILRGLTEAAHVACVSSATRRDLLRLTNLAPGKVDLVYNGLNYPYTPLARSEAVKRLRAACQRFGLSESLEAGFILHVGGNQWYKNRPGVIQLYAHLCKKMSAPPKLVMAGKALTPEMRRDISKDSLETRVIELTTVSNEELQTLYCTAGLLLFPSFEEGFGWPIIEAQASGCPVVTVNREPMVEVGGDAAIRFEIDGIGSLDNVGFSNRAVENGVNAVMKVLLESPDERLARIQIGLSNSARFSTDRMLEDYVSLYRRLLKPAGKTSLGKKQPVLAW